MPLCSSCLWQKHPKSAIWSTPCTNSSPVCWPQNAISHRCATKKRGLTHGYVLTSRICSKPSGLEQPIRSYQLSQASARVGQRQSKVVEGGPWPNRSKVTQDSGLLESAPPLKVTQILVAPLKLWWITLGKGSEFPLSQAEPMAAPTTTWSACSKAV